MRITMNLKCPKVPLKVNLFRRFAESYALSSPNILPSPIVSGNNIN